MSIEKVNFNETDQSCSKEFYPNRAQTYGRKFYEMAEIGNFKTFITAVDLHY